MSVDIYPPTFNKLKQNRPKMPPIDVEPQYRPKQRKNRLPNNYDDSEQSYNPNPTQNYPPTQYSRENSIISSGFSNPNPQPVARNRRPMNRPPAASADLYEDEISSRMESSLVPRSNNNLYMNNSARDPAQSFTPYSGGPDQRSDMEIPSTGYLNDPRSHQQQHPGSFHSALLPAEGSIIGSRRGSGSNDPQQNSRFWTPDINGHGTMPRGSAAKIASKKENAFTKLFSSMRKGKSQHEIDQVGLEEEPLDKRMQPANKSKNRFRSLSRSEVRDLTPVEVVMLDASRQQIPIDKSTATGRQLFELVCEEIQVCEIDFFGLTYTSKKYDTWFWLENDIKIAKQLSEGDSWVFHFQVKFYAPEPSLLQEDITRYQMVLQVRQDVYTRKLPCSWVTQALLGAFTLQSEIGDYDPQNPLDLAQLRNFQFVLNPTNELLAKIQELHQKQVGLTPAQADMRYLETAKRLELYGIDLHPARDTENVQILIGVGYHGVVIYRDCLRIGRFAWPKVLRISYEKNNFYITIRPDKTDPVETKIGFRLHNNQLAKRLWMTAVDHHAFFRLKEWKKPTGMGTLKRNALSGSQHQLASRTFFQNRNMSINRPNPEFDRTVTKLLTASMPMGLNQMKFGSFHSLANNTRDEEPAPGKSYGGSAHELAIRDEDELPRSESTLGNRRRHPPGSELNEEGSYMNLPPANSYVPTSTNRPVKPRNRYDDGSVISQEGANARGYANNTNRPQQQPGASARRFEIDTNDEDSYRAPSGRYAQPQGNNAYGGRGPGSRRESFDEASEILYLNDLKQPSSGNKSRPASGKQQPPIAGAWSYGLPPTGGSMQQASRQLRKTTGPGRLPSSAYAVEDDDELL